MPSEDQEKVGTPWRDGELDAIVSDYFTMLDAELRRLPYVKSHHNAALVGLTGRTHGSVEFKYQNISAVLEELGLPWILGYKPRRNYQAAIFDAIDRYLSLHNDVLNRALPLAGLVEQDLQVFVERPPLNTKAEPPARLKARSAWPVRSLNMSPPRSYVSNWRHPERLGMTP